MKIDSSKHDRSLYVGIRPLLAIFIGLAAIGTFVGESGYGIALNENQVLYLCSTSAQVIAAVYGLTLTGFVFFRNELIREGSEDATLVNAIDYLKTRYFILLLFITGLVGLALLLANLAIAYESSGDRSLGGVIVNAGQSAFVTSLFSVAYFIFDIISPDRIEKASRKLQSELDPTLKEQSKGSLEEFLRNFNEIESLLAKAGERYQESKWSSNNRYRRRLSNGRLAEILFRNDQIDQTLFAILRDLIAVRNSIIHGADPVVSASMVESSRIVLQRLHVALGPDEGSETWTEPEV